MQIITIMLLSLQNLEYRSAILYSFMEGARKWFDNLAHSRPCNFAILLHFDIEFIAVVHINKRILSINIWFFKIIRDYVLSFRHKEYEIAA